MWTYKEDLSFLFLNLEKVLFKRIQCQEKSLAFDKLRDIVRRTPIHFLVSCSVGRGMWPASQKPKLIHVFTTVVLVVAESSRSASLSRWRHSSRWSAGLTEPRNPETELVPDLLYLFSIFLCPGSLTTDYEKLLNSSCQTCCNKRKPNFRLFKHWIALSIR